MNIHHCTDDPPQRHNKGLSCIIKPYSDCYGAHLHPLLWSEKDVKASASGTKTWSWCRGAKNMAGFKTKPVLMHPVLQYPKECENVFTDWYKIYLWCFVFFYSRLSQPYKTKNCSNLYIFSVPKVMQSSVRRIISGPKDANLFWLTKVFKFYTRKHNLFVFNMAA